MGTCKVDVANDGNVYLPWQVGLQQVQSAMVPPVVPSRSPIPPRFHGLSQQHIAPENRDDEQVQTNDVVLEPLYNQYRITLVTSQQRIVLLSLMRCNLAVRNSCCC